jgi:hypothetical protein
MKTMIVILVVAVGAGIALLIAGALRKPDSHLAVSEQPVHKVPSTPPAAGAP